MAHNTAFDFVLDHLEREKSNMRGRSDDPSHHDHMVTMSRCSTTELHLAPVTLLGLNLRLSLVLGLELKVRVE